MQVARQERQRHLEAANESSKKDLKNLKKVLDKAKTMWYDNPRR